MNAMHRKGHYGIDAPYVPGLMAFGVLICLGLMVFAHWNGLWITVLILFALLLLFLHTSLRGKFVVWHEVLDALPWRGDEDVLDIGCGRGAVLLMAAEHVSRGKAVGIDIWSSKDQSGNAMEVTWANAEIEGVAGRVELHTADMRELPFADASFDLLVSNVAIHNIGDPAGRQQAIDEAWRVLRPGGRLLIADIAKVGEYVERLQQLHADVVRRPLGWRMWWGGPWVSTTLISAEKPLLTEALSAAAPASAGVAGSAL